VVCQWGVHVANSTGATATWSRRAGFHHELLTSFHFVKRTDDSCVGVRYTVKATRWNGGAEDGPVASDPSDGCRKAPYSSHKQAYDHGTSFDRDSNQAVEYGAAVSVLGVKLSATSGYSKFVRVEWRFQAPGWLCGDTGPPTTAHRLFAGNR
jgi:hypothetical protein